MTDKYNCHKCYECEKGLECGWSTIDPTKPHLISKTIMVNEPCENFCGKSENSDYTDEGLSELLIGIAKSAADEYISGIKKRERALAKIEVIKAQLKTIDSEMEAIKKWLPNGVVEKIRDKSAERAINLKDIETTKLSLEKLYCKRENLIIEIDELADAKANLYDSLTSGTASLNGMPHGGGDVHKFDNYAEIAAELNCKIDELIALNTKIKLFEKRAFE